MLIDRIFNASVNTCRSRLQLEALVCTLEWNSGMTFRPLGLPTLLPLWWTSMASRPLLTTSQPSLKLLTTKYWPTLMSNFVVIILRMHRWWTCLWIILVCKQAAQTRETLRGTQFGLHSYALLITWNHLLSWPFFWQFDSHFYSTIHHICEAANRAWLKIAWWYILLVHSCPGMYNSPVLHYATKIIS